MSALHLSHLLQQPPLPYSTTLLDAVEQLLHRLQVAFNQRDLCAVAACYAEDAILVNILGQRLYGRQHIVDYLGSHFQQRQGEYCHYQLLYLQPLDEHHAVLNVQQFAIDSGSNTPRGVTTAPLWVIRQHRQQWQIIASNAL